MQNTHSNRTGSTLIEVVGIIGLAVLMIALLLPSLQTPQDKSVPVKFASAKIGASYATNHHRIAIRTVKM